MIDISIARKDQFDDVRSLYARSGYTGGVADNDLVLIATDGGKVVGAVRLCPEGEGGLTVLRGMQVQDGFQRRGIGSRLLSACIPFLDEGIAYCLPYTHLVGFYRSAGFTVADQRELPGFLSDRLASYIAEGQNLLAMRRSPAGESNA
ncbi:MAG TPA: GNAT family N-acetyltransferase [Noviherbaspirillum sp.]|jgi:predicted N-acetyltransferase YhbS|uniref:GNAT family N-acetyltransferase n=1 Tax=Noviherbaspirillum sp. TaxID=1926288 RepID=UPI002DDC936B|nr:GNAT family N-acetyltransferase [Noviherbaspirillum sp.]HEV2610004.1 GNAT family N-acetyltransferase [Noviherbaspirillum sp.]